MTEEEIEKRMSILFLVLIYTNKKNALLNTGERIIINQERGYLLSLLGNTPMNDRTVPYEIEKKIDSIIDLIRITNWQIPIEKESD